MPKEKTKPRLEILFAAHNPDGMEALRALFSRNNPQLFLSERFGYVDGELDRLRTLVRGEISTDDYFDAMSLLDATSRSVMEGEVMIAGTGITVDFVDVDEHSRIFQETYELPSVESMTLPKEVPWREIIANIKALKDFAPHLIQRWTQDGVDTTALSMLYDMADELSEDLEEPSSQVAMISPYLSRVIEQIIDQYSYNYHPLRNAAFHWHNDLKAENRFTDPDRQALLDRELQNLKMTIERHGRLTGEREAHIVAEMQQKLDQYQPQQAISYYGTAHTTMRKALLGALGANYNLIMRTAPQRIIHSASDAATRSITLGKDIPEDLLAKAYVETFVQQWMVEKVLQPRRAQGGPKLGELQFRTIERMFLRDFTAKDLQAIFEHSKGLSDIQLLIKKGLDLRLPEVLLKLS